MLRATAGAVGWSVVLTSEGRRVIRSLPMPVRVLLVVADDWIGRLLTTALAEAGFVVEVKRSAKDATSHLDEVDAMIVDAGLRGDQATRILGELRQRPTAARALAFVLCHVEDADTRLEALDGGADCCVNKPFRVEEVVASLRALLRLRARIGSATAPDLSVDVGWDAPMISEAPSALSGDLEELSFGTILTMLEMERRSGVLTIEGARQTATVELSAGAAVQATLAGTGVSPIAVLRRVLRWKTGRFTFRAGQAAYPPDTRGSIGALLLEAAALEDEGAPSSLGSTRPSSPPPGVIPSPNTIATVRPAPFDAHEAPTSRGDTAPASRRPLKKPSVRPPGPPRPPPRPAPFALPRPPALPDVEGPTRQVTAAPRPGPPRPPPKRA